MVLGPPSKAIQQIMKLPEFMTVCGKMLSESVKTKKLLREFYWFSCYPIRCTLDFFIIICYCPPWTFFGLLKYINIKGVGATATRCVGIVWKFYNEEFRMKMAKNASASWGKVDQELWLTYIVPSASTVQRPLTGGRFLKCYDAYI